MIFTGKDLMWQDQPSIPGMRSILIEQSAPIMAIMQMEACRLKHSDGSMQT